MPVEPSVKVAECCSVEVTIVAHITETITPPSHNNSSKARCTAGMSPLFLSRRTMRMVISLTSQMKLRAGCHGVLASVSLQLLRSRAPLYPSKLLHAPCLPILQVRVGEWTYIWKRIQRRQEDPVIPPPWSGAVRETGNTRSEGQNDNCAP